MSATVTGIIDAPDFISEREANFLPRVFLTPAFLDEFEDSVAIYPGGITARLRNGERDVAAFTRAVRSLVPDDPALEIQPSSDVSRRIDESIRVLVAALVLCAVSAALALLVATGFAMSRHLSRSPTDVLTMRSLGMTARERIGASVTAMLPAAIGGAALSVVLAFAASTLMPVGIARDADPDLGLSFDPLVLGVGFLAVALCVTGLAAVSAWRAGRFAARTEATDAPSRARRPFRRATPIAAPVAHSLGVRMALEPGRGATAVPVRSAALGAVLGVIGVVATVVFAASLSATIDRPARFGFPWDAVVAGFEGDRADELVDALDDDRRIRALGILDTGVAVVGTRDVNAYAFEAVHGRTGPTMLEGRPIHGDDEVVLGAGTARELDVGVGDEVTVRGDEQRHRLEVVGLAALPVLDDRSGVDIGAIMSPRRLRSVAPDDSLNHDVLVRWASGVDAAAGMRRLERTSDSEVVQRALAVGTRQSRAGARAAVGAGRAPRGRGAARDRARGGQHGAAPAAGPRRVAHARSRRSPVVGARALAGFDLRCDRAGVRDPARAGGRAVVWHQVAAGIGVDATATTPAPALLLIAVVTFIVALVAAAVPAYHARHVRPATTLAVND